jgi:hypothetical protein
MNQQRLDEKELQKLLDLAKIAEQKLNQSSEGLTALAQKWQQKVKEATVQKLD